MTQPALEIGQRIAGAQIIAAIAQDAKQGYLPGMHIVTAENDREFITWEVAYQPGYGLAPHAGHYFAHAGHYFAHDGTAEGRVETRREALRDMIARYGA